MTSLIKPTLLTMVLMAQSCNYVVGNHKGGTGTQPSKPGHPVQAPEVDPSLAMGGLTLLAGMLTVIRSRRSR
jgi:hypothetical protein